MSGDQQTERRRSNDSVYDQFDARLTRFEDRMDERFSRLEEKFDSRAEWEKQIELRIAELEGKARLATWVLGTVTALVLAGILTLGWGLLTNKIDFVDHQAPQVIVVTPTP